MYTDLKSYQLIISLLKQYGITHCVLSAGSRNVPFVHSIEEDPEFHCYSVVDERSAGYFALGLAQELNEPVVISCTSSTATCNYWPPVAEAFYQGVPIVVLTSDRDPAMLGQWEDQMIDQVGMYDRHVRKSVNLPIINSRDDEIYCQRLINEALLELNHHGTGPVHINIPSKTYNNSFPLKELPKAQKINRIGMEDSKTVWEEKIEKLKSAKRILVTCGQNSCVSKKLNDELKKFFERYNCTISLDYMSNLDIEEGINTTVCMDGRYIIPKKVKELLPDIVISFGGQIFSSIKEELQLFEGKFEHWLIQEDGRVIDAYKSLTDIFECKPEYFFDKCNEMTEGMVNDRIYFSEFKEYADNIKIPEFPWSHVYAIKEVVEKIPSNSVLHLSINDSIRITNFFKLNSLRLKHIKNNVHILLINNEGGSEFYFNKIWRNEASDLHTTARHKTKAELWVKSNDFIYLKATDKDSLEESLKIFMNEDNEKPVFLEVFTEMKHDSQVIYDFFDLSRPKDAQSEVLRKSKDFLKSTIGQEKANKIKAILKKN